MIAETTFDLRIGPHPQQRGLYRLESRLWLPAPLEEVFPFFADASQLEVLTPPWLQFHILTPQPVVMQPGCRIDYRLKVHGLPLHWQSEITLWDPPRRFVDEQRRGPYRHWRHLHTFEAAEGGTWVGDEVDYAVPGGALLNALFVQRDLHRIFTFRSETLRRLFVPRRTVDVPPASAASAS